jgi:hypothetical protein
MSDSPPMNATVVVRTATGADGGGAWGGQATPTDARPPVGAVAAVLH